MRDVITTHHPLQPFDSRNFVNGELRTDGPFSYDPLGHAGAVAAAGPRTTLPPFLANPLPPMPPGDVELAALHRLLAHPARGFLRQRLQVAETRGEDEPADALPIELDALDLWAVGDRLLDERMSGLDPVACIALEQRRGTLPPGPLGNACLEKVGPLVDELLRASAPERAHESESHDVDAPLADGTRLTGTVGDVRGDVLLTVTYSKLAAKQKLRAWVDLVALSLTRPDVDWRAVVIGRGNKGPMRSVFGPLPPADAAAALEELVALYRAGLRSLLPLPVKTAAQYAFLRGRGTGAPAARVGAENEWVSGKFPGEQADAEHVLVYGDEAPFTILTTPPPEPGEGGSGWHADETDRFGLLARRLWARLLDAESAS